MFLLCFLSSYVCTLENIFELFQSLASCLSWKRIGQGNKQIFGIIENKKTIIYSQELVKLRRKTMITKLYIVLGITFAIVNFVAAVLGAETRQ